MSPRIVIFLPVVLAAVLAASSPADAAWAEAQAYEGTHVRLRTDVDPDRARELLAMLDLHQGTLRRLFGREPEHKGLLDVRLFALKEDYRRIVGNDAGGMYTFRDRTANVWVQARRYWTRHLLLHEATHQFVALAFTGNRDRLPWWLDEGFAEYCAFHVWDGKALRCPDPDVISIQNYPAIARRAFEDPGWTVETTLRGGYERNRAEAWMLVHHLMDDSRTRRRLLKLLATLPRKSGSGDEARQVRTGFDLFRKLVTTKLEDLTRDLRRRAKKMEPTWRVVTIAWDRRGDAVLGRSRATGVIAYHEPVESAEATISFRYRILGGRKGWVGVAHRVVDKDHFRTVTLTTPRSVRWLGLAGRRWTTFGSVGAQAARDDAWHVVRVRFRRDAVEVTVDGEPLPPIPRTSAEPLGTVGLFIDAAEAEFRDFDVRAVSPRSRR